MIAVDNTCAGLIDEFLPLSDPTLDGTPEYDQMMSRLWTTLGRIVDAWPIMSYQGIVCDGAEMGTIAAAFWYDGAVNYQAG